MLPCKDNIEQICQQNRDRNMVLSHLSSIDTTLMFLQKSIDGLTQTLQRGSHGISDNFTQSQSPLSITIQGFEMIKRVGLKNMFEDNWPRICSLIDAENQSKNPYDIQQFCIQQAVVFPEKFLTTEELDKVKIDAYNTGNPLMSYMKVVAVMARDRYFKEKGIDVSEVDINDPTKK